ncbi:MAG: polysulfide reductase NrfD [Candidatus Hydrogenedentes bacterium]|nr:polysulfide reductase NrfD [Candidatus Hydrogenedentota bacterium]
MIKEYVRFLIRAFQLSFDGTRQFYLWMAVLTVITVIGGNAYTRQFVDGLAATGMTDQVSWGAYIANFTFLVGVAAASVMLVIPAYIYRNKDMHDVVLYGELLAIAAIIMCLLFVMVDLGRPDRFWHLIPWIGKFNFPTSLLSWDVIVLNGYLVLNLHICGYLLFMKYMKRKPTPLFYVPFVFISIAWAVSIHTVTAFLYVGLVGRPFWNAAIVAPRFLGSAFTAGPGILIIAFQIMERLSHLKVSEDAYTLLRQIVTASLLINLFMLFCEAFKEFYSAALHNASAQYLFFGLEHNGHTYDLLVPWIWTAIVMEVIAAAILITPPVARRRGFLNVACVLAFVGIWIEKGMGLIIPGFIPTPLGNIVEYLPSVNEVLVCVGIWAFGLLLFSWMVHLAIPIMNGTFSKDSGVPRATDAAIKGEVS